MSYSRWVITTQIFEIQKIYIKNFQMTHRTLSYDLLSPFKPWPKSATFGKILKNPHFELFSNIRWVIQDELLLLGNFKIKKYLFRPFKWHIGRYHTTSYRLSRRMRNLQNLVKSSKTFILSYFHISDELFRMSYYYSNF